MDLGQAYRRGKGGLFHTHTPNYVWTDTLVKFILLNMDMFQADATNTVISGFFSLTCTQLLL